MSGYTTPIIVAHGGAGLITSQRAAEKVGEIRNGRLIYTNTILFSAATKCTEVTSY